MRDTRPRTKSDMNTLSSVSRMMCIGHSIKNYADSGDYVIIEKPLIREQIIYVGRFDTVHSSTARDRLRFKTDDSLKVQLCIHILQSLWDRIRYTVTAYMF